MEELRLFYNWKQQRLELNGHLLQRGENIELLVMGHWLPGRVDEDASGWYLLTYDGIGIRLHSGLIARPIESSFPGAISSREGVTQSSNKPEQQ